jgi:hypothetical protein
MASVAHFLERLVLRFEVRWWHWSLDERLAAGFDPASDPALAVRAEQLCSPRHRRRLAAWIERLADESEATGRRNMSSAVPIVREQVSAARASLLGLAKTVRDTELPIRPRGVAIVERLLTDADSDVYTKAARGAVALQVQAALRGLEAPESTRPALSAGRGATGVSPGISPS